MRKIESSGNAERATRLSSRAEARSRPNGFSTITRARVGQARAAEPLDHRPEQRGRDREVERGARRVAERCLSALNVAGSL